MPHLRDGALLGVDQQLGLRIVAVRAQHVLPDEAIEQILQLRGVVAAVDDETLVLEVKLGLGTELAAEELGRIGGGATDGLGHLDHVDDDGLDAVALALDLRLDARHLVAIEGIADATVHVDATHLG